MKLLRKIGAMISLLRMMELMVKLLKKIGVMVSLSRMIRRLMVNLLRMIKLMVKLLQKMVNMNMSIMIMGLIMLRMRSS